jgi:oxygen-independent coproporphyrinogen-3 oxidase
VSGKRGAPFPQDPQGATSAGRDVGLYVHIPFCTSRCSYCTFVTSTELTMVPRTMAAVTCEVAAIGRSCLRPLASLYLGGGTPSLLDGQALRKVLQAVHAGFGPATAAEVTLEANPDDVTESKVLLWRSLGINRVSLGVQAFQDRVLGLLARRHSARQAHEAAWLLKNAGFVLSVDLMLGLPALHDRDVEDTLAELARLRPHHVSVYLLETDKPHRLGELAARRPGLLPNDDTAAAQYLFVGRALVAAGYRHYELANFALRGFEARHNTRYWLGLAVLAAGVAAHGQSGRRRWANVGGLATYLGRVEGGRSAVDWSRRLADDEWAKEKAMLGLRLARGVDAGVLGCCGELAPDFAVTLEDFLRLGLARRRAARVRLTPRGWLLSNELFATLW